MLKKSITGVLFASCLSAVHATAFNIVLSNDDGWNSAGIQAMKTALVNAGHTVVLSAPLSEQSGSSAGFDIDDFIVLKQREVEDEGALEYAVALEPGEGEEPTEGAEPVTAAMVGLSIVEQATGELPDLVVSGINSGQNIGAGTQTSGTIGVVTAAISSFFGGALVPAIAISTDPPCDEEAEDDGSCAELAAAHYAVVADFTVQFIATLENETTDGPLMPPGFGVNINYPQGDSIDRATVNRQGLTFINEGRKLSLQLGCRGDCVNARVGEPVPGGITGVSAPPNEEVENADTTSNLAGNITVVAISPDFTAGSVTERAKTAGFLFNNKLARVLRAMGY